MKIDFNREVFSVKLVSQCVWNVWGLGAVSKIRDEIDLQSVLSICRQFYATDTLIVATAH